MNLLFVVLQHAEEAAAQPGVFEWSTNVSVWTVIIFLALLAVLAKLAFPPILGYANAREQRIQEILDQAARDREEAQRILEAQRRELAEARQQAQQVLAEARQAGERMRQEMLERARAEQDELIARTRQDLEREREAAIEALRREAVDLSLAAASRLLEQRLGDEQDRALVREYLDRIGAGSGAGAA
ncbi:MAG TPA: F0F1 ATP synthase subunit B [Longimicrobiales bacterium]